MAVAMTPDKPQESEAQTRLRRAVQDVKAQLGHPSKSELMQARDDLDRHWITVSKELLRLAKPLTPYAPKVMGTPPGEPTPARIAQLKAIDEVCRLLELARQVRGEANLALFQTH